MSSLPPDPPSVVPGALRRTNRLALEKSPYLLQHAHNPVDWYPWAPEAFAKARAESKPIFLSIGYSTCHWCHVMERESFEEPAVAAFLAEHFVSIKVDREERPDVDRIYMTFVQALTGSGGWPLSVFLTPDLKPFYGGTYFPPEDRHGHPAFGRVLDQIREAWARRPQDLRRSAEQTHRRLVELSERAEPTPSALNPGVVQAAVDAFKTQYDPEHAGWGGAPKFPRPAVPSLLLQWGVRTGDREAVEMVLRTCDRMAAGGIHDQLGGGFARYAVDGAWLVPHFEKMLYDNAQLAQLYLDAYLVSGQCRHAQTARDILDYVLRDMTHPDGGFCSAEDADSEGKEGKFYCWTLGELKELLTPAECAAATRCFGITAEGNFIDHSDPNPLPGQNVLSLAAVPAGDDEAQRLRSAKAKLLARRVARVRPHRDDKILVSWNGLMLGAFARAGAILGEPAYRVAAERNVAFVRRRLWDPATCTLYHRWRDGEHDAVQLLEAYAFWLAGLLDLYETTLEAAHLEFALDLAGRMVEKFYDPEAGGFWQTEAGAADLILRSKEDYDGAEPSGNSVAILALLKLAAIGGRADLRAVAEASLQALADRVRLQPQAVPNLVSALAFSVEAPRRVVVAGPPGDTQTTALLRAVHGTYQPHKVVVGWDAPAAVDPAVRAAARPGQVLVCQGTVCQAPVSDPDAVARALSGAVAGCEWRR